MNYQMMLMTFHLKLIQFPAVPSDVSSVLDLLTSLVLSEGNPSNTEVLINPALLAMITAIIFVNTEQY